MRPQHITAENVLVQVRARAAAVRASMRPQHITAENNRPVHPHAGACGRFNEAAAYHCGKPPEKGLPILYAMGLQ